jgi:mycothiol synthase
VVELSWVDRLDESGVAEVAALIDAATEADGVSPVSEHVLLHLRHEPPDASGAVTPEASGAVTNLLARDGAMLAGYAHLDLTDQFGGATGELVVHPWHRRHGVATTLVGALLDRMDRADSNSAAGTRHHGVPGAHHDGAAGAHGHGAAGAHDHGAAGAHGHGGRLRLWAHGEHPGAARLAERFGFTKARVLLQLRRSLLSPLERPRLPEGVRLRPFVVGADEQRFVEVNNRAFAWHPEQGGWDVESVRIREAEAWFDPEGFLLAVDVDDRLLGFHWTKVHSKSEPIGEVYVLGVDPSAHGRGLGVGLTLAGLHYLRGKGLHEVMLYVEADNEAAVAMYRKLGFTNWDTDVAYLRRL